MAYTQVAKIPFELCDNTSVFIKLSLNNSTDSLTFFFDTGATSSLIDSKTAQKIGLVSNYEASITGAGGVKKYSVALNQTVNFSEKVRIDSTNIAFEDLSRLNKYCVKFDGIIGYDILKNYKTKIDFDKKVIELYEFNTNLDTKDYSELNFEGITIPQIPVTIELKNGKKLTDKVFFDSGAGLSLLINTPFKEKNDLVKEIGKVLITETNNLSSKSISEEAIIKSLQIGNYTFGENTILLSSDKEGVSSSDGYLGILGAVIINRFNIILDYSNKKLYLKPNTIYNTPFEFNVSGIRLKMENDLIIVSQVNKLADAYRKGLRENYIIVSINGITTSNIDDFRKLLKKENSKVKIVYKTEDGKIKKMKLKLKRLL